MDENRASSYDDLAAQADDQRRKEREEPSEPRVYPETVGEAIVIAAKLVTELAEMKLGAGTEDEKLAAFIKRLEADPDPMLTMSRLAALEKDAKLLVNIYGNFITKKAIAQVIDNLFSKEAPRA